MWFKFDCRGLPERLRGMKRCALLCSIVSFVLACSGIADESSISSKIEKASGAYSDAIEAAYQSYRKAFSDAIAGATNVEVYLLDFETKPVKGATEFSSWILDLPKDQFPILPYVATSRILKRKKLSADEIALLMPSLQATIAVEKNNGGAMCHFPIHGIRIWSGDEIVFQTSICYQCMNFYMTYPFGRASWTGLSDPKFREVMEKLMPIPQAEIDRFDAKYRGKKKASKK